MAVIFFRGRYFQKEMILHSNHWYLTYALNYQDIEDLMKERGFDIDHGTINR